MSPEPLRLAGTWRLVSVTARGAGQSVSRPYGDRPQGLLTYTDTDWMAVIIVLDELTPPICYAGRVRTTPDSVSHVVEVGVPPFSVGTVQSRRAHLGPDGFLTLVAPAGTAGDTETAFLWKPA